MRIVCGTDFSVHASKAAEVAAAMAARCKTPLKLVHALEPDRLDLRPANRKRRRDSAMVQETNRLRETGAEVIESLADGRPYDVLADAAPPSEADLIVVSTVGRSAPSRLLTGSVAEKTAQLSKVPTLVVRDHEPLLSWAKGERTLKVLVGYDFSASSDAALRLVASLRGIGDCRVTVVYVSWPPGETLRFGIGGRPPFNENDLIVRTLLERDLKERCARALGKGRSKLRVIANWGAVDEKLIELAKTEEADLVVVGTNQRLGLSRYWLGSVSRGVLHGAPMNVACVPAAEELNAAGTIPVYRRVLVPTDFSKHGNRAIPFAYGAVPWGGEVCLVHVIPPAGGFRAKTEREDGVRARRKQRLAERLEALVPEEARSRGIRSRVEIVEHQHPDAAIGQAAERFAADLICIGSRNRSGLKTRLTGSVTEGLMRRSSRPVLVIRE